MKGIEEMHNLAHKTTGVRIDGLQDKEVEFNTIFKELTIPNSVTVRNVRIARPGVRVDCRDWDLRVDICYHSKQDNDGDIIKDIQNKFVDKLMDKKIVEEIYDNGIYSEFDIQCCSFYANFCKGVK